MIRRGQQRHILPGEHPDYVSPGTVIYAGMDCLRGHGTVVRKGKVVASISGIVEWMDQLVTVRPLRTRYVASTSAIGDVVVGRVSEVVLGAGQRWKIDVGSQQDAHLLLSAIAISGSARERRWTEEHADMEMRSYFVENDVVRIYCSPSPTNFGTCDVSTEMLLVLC
jgi:exosome complex component RRP4